MSFVRLSTFYKLTNSLIFTGSISTSSLLLKYLTITDINVTLTNNVFRIKHFCIWIKHTQPLRAINSTPTPKHFTPALKLSLGRLNFYLSKSSFNRSLKSYPSGWAVRLGLQNPSSLGLCLNMLTIFKAMYLLVNSITANLYYTLVTLGSKNRSSTPPALNAFNHASLLYI